MKKGNDHVCEACGATFNRYVSPCRAPARFCSIRCKGVHMRVPTDASFRRQALRTSRWWTHFGMMWGWLGVRAFTDQGPTQQP